MKLYQMLYIELAVNYYQLFRDINNQKLLKYIVITKYSE